MLSSKLEREGSKAAGKPRRDPNLPFQDNSPISRFGFSALNALCPITPNYVPLSRATQPTNPIIQVPPDSLDRKIKGTTKRQVHSDGSSRTFLILWPRGVHTGVVHHSDSLAWVWGDLCNCPALNYAGH